jgi:hypothetical protein
MSNSYYDSVCVCVKVGETLETIESIKHILDDITEWVLYDSENSKPREEFVTTGKYETKSYLYTKAVVSEQKSTRFTNVVNYIKITANGSFHIENLLNKLDSLCEQILCVSLSNCGDGNIHCFEAYPVMLGLLDETRHEVTKWNLTYTIMG